MVERGNPAAHTEAFREQRRERFLTSEELACLGDAIRGAEATGIAWEIDEAKPTAKHIPKENRVTALRRCSASNRIRAASAQRLGARDGHWDGRGTVNGVSRNALSPDAWDSSIAADAQNRIG